MPYPKWIPFAIDVTDEVPVKGKPWSGGQGNSKLVLHTIEGADPWDIGWPRDWSRWNAAPHLAMNSDRFPDGDWLYQTLPLDVAGYAIRDNTLEDDRFTWQMEMAGRARNVEGYDDQFYQAIAKVADWFVDEMGAPNVWMDFSCAQAGEYSPCRRTQAEVDAFGGFLGHCHVGRGTDKHWDPGKLDAARVQRFMTTGGNMPCPWNNDEPWSTSYVRCDDHYDVGKPIEWGVNTGVCSVPPWGRESVHYQVEQKVIILKDNNRDDFERNLTDGRWWVMDHRKVKTT